MLAKSHLISTDQPSRIYLIKDRNNLAFTTDDPEFTKEMGGNTRNQIIVLTNDEEIKEGDWFIESNGLDGVYLFHYTKEISPNKSGNAKVIASSSKELTHSIDESLIQNIIKYYNKHKEMPNVKLNSEIAWINDDTHGEVLILNSFNEVSGTVAWKNPESINETYERLGIDISDEPSVKKMYSREEVKYFLRLRDLHIQNNFSSKDTILSINTWIEENLK